MHKSFFSTGYTVAYRLLLANIFCIMLFAKDPDYMNMQPNEAAKAWHNYQDSNVTETFRQYRKFIHAFSGKFPLDFIRKRAEEAAYYKTDSQEKLIKYFEFNPVLTSKGLIAYVTALLETNQHDRIGEVVQKYWLEIDFTKDEMDELIQIAKPFLKKADYNSKMNTLLSQEKHEHVQHFLRYVDIATKKIAQLRLNIQKNNSTAKKAVAKALGSYKKNPDVLLDVVRWYRKAYKTDQAIALLESLDPKAEKESPLTWWNERHILARRMTEEGNWNGAYEIVLGHKLKKGEAFANAEWLLGWIELTKINKKDKAITRFINLHGCVNMPVSKARMAFWAAEALTSTNENDRAKEFYKKASDLPGTFYGQIALSRLRAMGEENHALDLEKHKMVSEEAEETFNNRFIIKCLKAYGERLTVDLQLTLLSFAGSQLTVPGEQTLITEFAHELGGTYLAVFVAKKAQYLGTVITNFGYPMLDERLRADIFSKLPPLIQCFAHGIIRQESNFSESAVSTAKAKGLMQLMDGTANAMRKLAPRYGLNRVSGGIHDRRVNVTLGTTHLLEHLEKYNGYVVLALAAYNAGHSNANKWIKMFGDPRETGDWINWIESIPFGETRNYVNRVLENAAVYAALILPSENFEMSNWVKDPIPYVKHK
jgi:soluble lytic murein transglycosylase